MVSNIISNLLVLAVNIINYNDKPSLVTQIIFSIIIPIIVAILAYIFVNRLGEWQKRRNYSKLGVAIIESLQEEIKTGINVMKGALEAVNNPNITVPPPQLLSNKSWSGMLTISDDVLLRIIATSEKHKFTGFHPRECRIHCKNYFVFICQNYKQAIDVIYSGDRLSYARWREIIKPLLVETGTARYIEAAEGVYNMLENTKQLLQRNSKTIFPK